MSEADSEYEIDYSAVDVEDVMRQVREHARRRVAGEPTLPALDRADVAAHLRERLDLDDRLPYELQRELHLAGGWNVAPEDLYSSHPGVIGTLISSLRRLLRPVVKLAANTDLPLHKQFKVNIGVAAALHDLMCENAALLAEVDALRRRIDALEAHNSAETDDRAR